jgi:uncharacterized protein (TIGR02145 family)
MKHIFTISLCFLALSLSAQVDCPNTHDSNSDGAITIDDLLDLLGIFGDTDSDSDGVWDSEDDCIDETACNYQSNPTVQCNYLDVVGVCGGLCIEDADGDGICDWECGEDIGHEGYDYSTVQIGEQCWFSENCRYLPSVSPSSASSTFDPYYYVYDYEGTNLAAAQATENYEAYGVLYNWPAVMTNGICPSGWHIPSDGEWMELEMFLGMSEAVANEIGYRGTDEGSQMKSINGWGFFPNYWPYNYNSNSSGFNGLPSGYTDNNGGSGFMFQKSYLWSSTSWSYSYSLTRRLHYDEDYVLRYTEQKRKGYSARCVRD